MNDRRREGKRPPKEDAPLTHAGHRRAAAALAILVASACGVAAHGPLGGSGAPASTAVVATIPVGDYPTDIAMRSDGARAYVTLRTGKVQAIDTTSRQVAATIVTDGQPGAIALGPDGRRGYVMDMTAQNAFAIDTISDRLLTRIPVGTMQRPVFTPSVAVAPDGRRAYVTNATTKDDHVLVVDTASNAIVKDRFLDFHPVGVAVSPDGRTVYVAGCKLACIDGTLAVIDAATAAVTSTIALPAPPSGLALAPDGVRAYVTNGREATVGVVDLRTKGVETIPVGAQPLGIAFGPRGRFVFVPSFGDARIDVIDSRTNAVVTSVRVASQPRAIAISPDGRFAYVIHTSSSCSVIDLSRVTGS